MTDKLVELCTDLSKELEDNQFIAEAKIYRAVDDGNIRYSLNYNGTFSIKDMQTIAEVAKKHDCYLEVNKNGACFSMWLPYAESYGELKDKVKK